MRALAMIAAIVLIVLSVLMLMPEAGALHGHLPLATLAVSVVLLVAIFLTRTAQPTSKDAIAQAAKPPAVPLAENRADAEVVSFLAVLQERGRLVDFVMDDITKYSDAQVGAAARVVHAGCRAAIAEHFGILPVRDESEGAKVSVPAGYPADEYRLIGKIGGEAPFAGTLVHRGWRAEWVKLPRLLRAGADRLPTIAPAEVELR